MKQLDLNGLWQLGESAPGAGDAQGWYRTGVPADQVVPAQVPGDVHLDLLRAGRIAEPLYGKNVLDCRWVEARDWWYSRTFTVDDALLNNTDRVELHADGLDLTAEIWLNGQPVGHHNNQFTPATFDVTDAVRPGENLLVVRLDVGLQAAPSDRRRYVHISSLPASGLPRMWMRKAQFSFGWDWAPRLLTCGIWRPVALRTYKRLAIRDVFLASHLENGTARVRVQAEIESFAESAQVVRLALELRGDQAHSHELEVTLQPGINLVETELLVPNPTLWWPRPLGEPFLYRFSLEASERGRKLDRYETQFGIREINLAQEPLPGDEAACASEGTSFTIQVNGQPVFCQGANWVPADSIPARVSREKYEALITAAAEANFNMLRIWGGGIYEDPYFYQLCDQAGIMVWQDFMFACSLYPDDDAGFCAEVQREAETIVRQLRNHPCLVLWCGNNENDWIYSRRVHDGWEIPTFYGHRIYHEILPEVCARLDPTRPYWPSSPYGEDDPNSELAGDRHHWDVPINLKDPFERVDFRRWGADRGKFISEYGMLSPPVEDSLRRFLPPDELYVGSPAWDFHNNRFEKDNLATCLRLYWREPEALSLMEYVLATQIIQAEALKYSLEHFRCRKFATSGALFWAYSDCWGAIGWSIVDYYLNKKPAFYYVRRALSPLMVSFHVEEHGLTLWLTNGTLQSYECLVEYGVLDLTASTRQVEMLETVSSANSVRRVTSIPLPPASCEQGGHFVPFARLLVDGHPVSRNRWFLTGFRFKDLCLPPAGIEHTLEQIGDQEFGLQLEATAFAWAVRLQVPPSVWVEDNYFDLLPGERHEIMLRGPAADVSRLRVMPMNTALQVGC
jgi:beta-mannosidase